MLAPGAGIQHELAEHLLLFEAHLSGSVSRRRTNVVPREKVLG
jgi:hypothetical protein